MTRLQTVQKALNLMRDAEARSAGWIPGLAARIAIVNADLNDRRVGLTFEAEETPGSQIADQVLRAVTS